MIKIQFLLVMVISFASKAQLEKMEIMDKKCKELVRVIAADSKHQWKKYIQENCAESLIARYVKITPDGFSHTTSPETSNSKTNTLEAKIDMFRQLHDEIGEGKIKHLRIAQGIGEILLKGKNRTYKVEVNFANKDPYLIIGLSVKPE